MFGNQFSGASGFFLSPIPRDRHQDLDRKQQDRLQQERPREQPPPRLPCPNKPSSSDQPQSQDKEPARRSRTFGTRKREADTGGSCTAQLQLVDQDILTGRTYIHALDKRFRILSRNLRKAMKDCEQVHVTTTSNVIEIPQDVSQNQPECSELAVQLPKYAQLEEINENNDWGSAIESIQQMIPMVIDTKKDNNNDPSGELAPELRSTCESFRNYRRGQRFGRYGYGYAYDSDFDSDAEYDYGYGRRYPRYYSRRGYMTDYGDPDFDYYRSPYGRRGYPYGRYYGGRGYGRYGRVSYHPARSSIRGSTKRKEAEESKKPRRFDSYEDHALPNRDRKRYRYDGRRQPGRGRRRYQYELYDDYSSEGFSTDSDLFSDSEMEDYRSDKRPRFGRRGDSGDRRGDSGDRRRDSGDRRRDPGDRRQSNERYSKQATSRNFGHSLHFIKTRKNGKKSSKNVEEHARKRESIASQSSLAESDFSRHRSHVVCHRYEPYRYGRRYGGYGGYGGYGRRNRGYGGRYGRRRYGSDYPWRYGGRYRRSGRYSEDMLDYYSSDYGYGSGLSGYGYGGGAYDTYPYMPYYDSQSFFTSSDDDFYGGHYGRRYHGYGRGCPYDRRYHMSSIMGRNEEQKAIEETNKGKTKDETPKSQIKEEVTTSTANRKCVSESHHSDPQTYSKEPESVGCICRRHNRKKLKHHGRKADGMSVNSA